MVILRLLIITSLAIIHLEVVQLKDVAGGRPVREKVRKHLSNTLAARDIGFQVGSTSHVKEAVYPNNIRDHPVTTIPSKP